MDYEETLANTQPELYDFLFPKSKYYQYYTHQLYQHGPNSTEQQEKEQ